MKNDITDKILLVCSIAITLAGIIGILTIIKN